MRIRYHYRQIKIIFKIYDELMAIYMIYLRYMINRNRRIRATYSRDLWWIRSSNKEEDHLIYGMKSNRQIREYISDIWYIGIIRSKIIFKIYKNPESQKIDLFRYTMKRCRQKKSIFKIYREVLSPNLRIYRRYMMYIYGQMNICISYLRRIGIAKWGGVSFRYMINWNLRNIGRN